MSDIQILLAVVVIILTILLVIVGAQVIFVMLDLRRVIKRLNSILEDSILGGGLIRPEKLTGVLEMFRKNKRMKDRGDTKFVSDTSKFDKTSLCPI